MAPAPRRGRGFGAAVRLIKSSVACAAARWLFAASAFSRSLHRSMAARSTGVYVYSCFGHASGPAKGMGANGGGKGGACGITRPEATTTDWWDCGLGGVGLGTGTGTLTKPKATKQTANAQHPTKQTEEVHRKGVSMRLGPIVAEGTHIVASTSASTSSTPGNPGNTR